MSKKRLVIRLSEWVGPKTRVITLRVRATRAMGEKLGQAFVNRDPYKRGFTISEVAR